MILFSISIFIHLLLFFYGSSGYYWKVFLLHFLLLFLLSVCFFFSFFPFYFLLFYFILFLCLRRKRIKFTFIFSSFLLPPFPFYVYLIFKVTCPKPSPHPSAGTRTHSLTFFPRFSSCKWTKISFFISLLVFKISHSLLSSFFASFPNLPAHK